jgi:hypothetical protein
MFLSVFRSYRYISFFRTNQGGSEIGCGEFGTVFFGGRVGGIMVVIKCLLNDPDIYLDHTSPECESNLRSEVAPTKTSPYFVQDPVFRHRDRKSIFNEKKRLFLNQVAPFAKFNHPCLLHLFGFSISPSGGNRCLILPLMKNGNLDAKIDRKVLPVSAFFYSACEADHVALFEEYEDKMHKAATMRAELNAVRRQQPNDVQSREHLQAQELTLTPNPKP